MSRVSRVFFISILLFTFYSLNLGAQQWTAEQKEVWAGVETYWKVGMSANPIDFINYFDDSYFGWSYENEAPRNAAAKKTRNRRTATFGGFVLV